MNKIMSLVALLMTMCSTFQVFAACQQDDDHIPESTYYDGTYYAGK
ncbi:MAG: hypothetical protein ACOH2G_05270 [Ewingella sp.]